MDFSRPYLLFVAALCLLGCDAKKPISLPIPFKLYVVSQKSAIYTVPLDPSATSGTLFIKNSPDLLLDEVIALKFKVRDGTVRGVTEEYGVLSLKLTDKLSGEYNAFRQKNDGRLVSVRLDGMELTPMLITRPRPTRQITLSYRLSDLSMHEKVLRLLGE